MLKKEAIWIVSLLQSLDVKELDPLLNVGSSTSKFEKNEQPWIDTSIFQPLRQRQITVHHLDIKEALGVTLLGDITDNMFLKAAQKLNCRAVLCANLLEHVTNK